MERAKAAFLSFYCETNGRLYGWLLARCGDKDLAQDLAAEAYLGTLRACMASDEAPSSSLLFTIAKRRLIDHWRRAKTDEDKLVRIAAEMPRSRTLDQSDERMLRALNSLPERQRAAVAMRYLDGYGVAEIADLLEVSYKSAESLLARGRQALRKLYGKETGHVS